MNQSVFMTLAVLIMMQNYVFADKLPKIPEIIFGVNQYSVGKPADLTKHWPLNDEDITYLKNIGCNTIKFPFYPSEAGLDESAMMDWNTGDKFEPAKAGKPDWRSLDALIEWCIKHKITPYICPVAEKMGDWTTKAWMSLHIPESAQRTEWFTKLTVDHVTEKFGDQAIYGWYENWFWNSYRHEKSAEFPKAFRKKMKDIYKNRISSLNKNWNTDYESFDEVEIPKIYVNGENPEDAINDRRSFDLRKAADLMQRDVLNRIYKYVKKKAPNAIWTGGCLLGETGGMFDIQSMSIPRMNATMRTAAITSDMISADLYGEKYIYYSYYRTLSKIAAMEGKKLLITEAAATKPRTFGWILDVGGPSGGTLAWVGKEDTYGFIMWDGTQRTENGAAYKRMYDRYNTEELFFSEYKPGNILVYFPEETLYYSISERNQMDAYQHICDFMDPMELEPIFTSELDKLPEDSMIYVLERTIPLKAIKILESMGDRVICPHTYFIDENGAKHQRKPYKGDFFKQLLSLPEGKKLLDAFQRVEEKENNVSLKYYGTTVVSQSELAPKNKVLGDRENDIMNLIDGSVNEGVTFADKNQDEKVYLKLNRNKSIYGAFIQFYEGNGQDVERSPIPGQIIISTSMDGMNYTEIARLTGDEVKLRPHIRFNAHTARYICFDFGNNSRPEGLLIEELGVIGPR